MITMLINESQIIYTTPIDVATKYVCTHNEYSNCWMCEAVNSPGALDILGMVGTMIIIPLIFILYINWINR